MGIEIGDKYFHDGAAINKEGELVEVQVDWIDNDKINIHYFDMFFTNDVITVSNLKDLNDKVETLLHDEGVNEKDLTLSASTSINILLDDDDDIVTI